MTNRPISFRLAAALAGISLAAALLLSGCAKVGPEYVRPDIQMPQTWNSTPETTPAARTGRESLAQWWTRFNDPVLTSLVQRALGGNLSLREAVARVKQARAQRLIARADLLPGFTLSASAGFSESRFGGEWKASESYGLGLDVSWEADIFGRTRLEMEAVLADYEAAREDYNGVMVSLAAEMATAYIDLRTYQKRLEAAHETLKLQQETAELTQIKYQTGMAGALNVEQAAYSLESTRSQIPDLESGVEEMKNRLAVLLGGWPGELNQELTAPGPIPQGSLETDLGVPADLIRRRPDIRAAERRLAGETIRVGATKAGFYPRLTLTGSLGLDSSELIDFFSDDAASVGLGVGFSWSIFNQDEKQGSIQVQTAQQEQALIDYQTALRTAVEEVENAMTSMAKEIQKQQFLAKAVDSAQEAASLALQEYESGITDFENVLETQQSLASFKDKLSQSYGQAALNLIVMYKALGGGWLAEEESPEASTASKIN